MEKTIIEAAFVDAGGKMDDFNDFAVWAWDHEDSMNPRMIADNYRTKHPDLEVVNDSDCIKQGTTTMYKEWIKTI